MLMHFMNNETSRMAHSETRDLLAIKSALKRKKLKALNHFWDGIAMLMTVSRQTNYF